MEFDSDFWIDMGNSSSVSTQIMPSPCTTTSISSSPPANQSCTLTSRGFVSNELPEIDMDDSRNFASGHGELKPLDSALDMFMPCFDALPNSPMKRGQFGSEYAHIVDMHMAYDVPVDSTPSDSFDIYACSPDISMPTTQSRRRSSTAEAMSPWPYPNDSNTSVLLNGPVVSSDIESLRLQQHSQSSLDYTLHLPATSACMQTPKIVMARKIQQRAKGLQWASVGQPGRQSIKSDPPRVDLRSAMHICDCGKVFQRPEHLKRHKQNFHNEKPNRFSCEFCGKDRYNRLDNLNNHRKLHTRPNSGRSRVMFVPAAVPIIEKEERSRNPRAPSAARTSLKEKNERTGHSSI